MAMATNECTRRLCTLAGDISSQAYNYEQSETPERELKELKRVYQDLQEVTQNHKTNCKKARAGSDYIKDQLEKHNIRDDKHRQFLEKASKALNEFNACSIYDKLTQVQERCDQLSREKADKKDVIPKAIQVVRGWVESARNIVAQHCADKFPGWYKGDPNCAEWKDLCNHLYKKRANSRPINWDIVNEEACKIFDFDNEEDWHYVRHLYKFQSGLIHSRESTCEQAKSLVEEIDFTSSKCGEAKARQLLKQVIDVVHKRTQ